MQRLQIDTSARRPLLKAQSSSSEQRSTLPKASAVKTHTGQALPSTNGDTGTLRFIGTATTILEWQGFRIMTDPNFLHAGDHVHLGPGVTATRKTNPALELEDLPPLDCILLSHYHADHFDQDVEERLNRAFPIISTPHAKSTLSTKAEPFSNVFAVDTFQAISIEQAAATIRVTAMPGKHVPPGLLSMANDLLGAVPPINGWLLELCSQRATSQAELKPSYRIYITGDTLFIDDLKQIPEWLGGQQVDLMLCHLGGTTIPGPSLPLLMVTMDAKQGIQLMTLIKPDVTIPIHFDDYDVFLSPLEDFKKEVNEAGWQEKVVYLDRGEEYRFAVPQMSAQA